MQLEACTASLPSSGILKADSRWTTVMSKHHR
uniref:Uncharacterized protein n=1 Tax=Rhizophora mucronata TaxID=61149 RepID=A0A2P2JJZ0_RHIMU